MNEEKLYRLAIQKWGVPAQRLMIIEELSELIKVVAKIGRKVNGATVTELVDEIVDVEIMIAQLKVMADIKDVDEQKRVKLERLAKMLGVEAE